MSVIITSSWSSCGSSDSFAYAIGIMQKLPRTVWKTNPAERSIRVCIEDARSVCLLPRTEQSFLSATVITKGTHPEVQYFLVRITPVISLCLCMQLETHRRAWAIAQRMERDLTVRRVNKVRRVPVARKPLSLRDSVFPLRAALRRHTARKASYFRWRAHRHATSTLRTPVFS